MTIRSLAARLRQRRGFTLIELLIVMVVLGILFTMGLFLFNDVRASAEKTAMKAKIRAAYTSAKAYQIDNGAYAAGMIDGTQLGDVTPVAMGTLDGANDAGDINVQAICGDKAAGGGDDFMDAPPSGALRVCISDTDNDVFIAGLEAGQVFSIREVDGSVTQNL